MARPIQRPPQGHSATESREPQAHASNESEANLPENHDGLEIHPVGETQEAPVEIVTESQARPAQDRAATSHDVLVALTYGLELARHGAMLVEAEGRPQLANKAAWAILQKQDGISIARTGLVADRASDTRLLHKLLQEAISSPESGEPKESPMTLQRKIARTALIVRVVPGPGVNFSDAGGMALLKLYDQDMGLVVDQRALSSLYGLTRGEAALATRLVQGRSIEEAAAELFISAHTARTHLKRIFMKTDTHRQTELVVRMLLTVL